MHLNPDIKFRIKWNEMMSGLLLRFLSYLSTLFVLARFSLPITSSADFGLEHSDNTSIFSSVRRTLSWASECNLSVWCVFYSVCGSDGFGSFQLLRSSCCVVSVLSVGVSSALKQRLRAEPGSWRNPVEPAAGTRTEPRVEGRTRDEGRAREWRWRTLTSWD